MEETQDFKKDCDRRINDYKTIVLNLISKENRFAKIASFFPDNKP